MVKVVMNKKAVVIMIMMTGGGDIVPNDVVAWLIFLRIP
jgi:hypothetical protein